MMPRDTVNSQWTCQMPCHLGRRAAAVSKGHFYVSIYETPAKDCLKYIEIKALYF